MCSDRHGAHANQTVPPGSQSRSLPAPGSGDGERPSWGHKRSVFSFRETPPLFFSHYPRGPGLCKPPSQQHAPASGQRSGIIEVVFIYLFLLHTLVSLCRCNRGRYCSGVNPWHKQDWDFIRFWFLCPSSESPLSCPMTAWKKKSVIYSESKNLWSRRD